MDMHLKDLKAKENSLISGLNCKTQSIVLLTQANQVEWLIKILKVLDKFYKKSKVCLE